MTALDAATTPRRLGWVVFFTSAGLLGFEVSLMRVLLVVSWHHFAFLVISIALLGFGASGTALSLLRARVLSHGPTVLLFLVLGGAVSMPVCVDIAQHLPIEARITPALIWRQIGWWILYWALLGVPFFLGAGAIGLALMSAGRSIPRIYAANLMGSTAGLVAATCAMAAMPPRWLALSCAAILLIGALTGPAAVCAVSPWRRWLPWGVAVALVVAPPSIHPPHLRPDPYKYGAYVHRLERQGDAQRIAVAYGPRGVVEAYRGDRFHDLPFLSVGAPAPSVSALVVDGHSAGSVLDAASLEDAAVMDHTVTAFSYAFAPSRPKVLLPGEAGGANVWLAARHGAASITILQPNARITAMLRGPLSRFGGGVLDLPGARVVTAEPRHFIDRTTEPFDLIQLVTLESAAVGSGGVRGMAQDDLVTVEGIAGCLERLTGDGLLVTTRGIQTPPRDNVKLIATFAAALRRIGVTTPDRHIVIVRDYLGICTLAKRSPWTAAQIERVRRECARRQLTPVWFTGVRSDELNKPDALGVPPGGVGDWYHHAARRLLSPTPDAFIRDWPFDVRPPIDDRPFFLDFCKLGSLGDLERAFGDLWLTRVESAFLFVLAAIILIGVIGAILTVVPLWVQGRVYRTTGWGVTLAYFGAIGLAYLLLEMTFLSRMTRWVGDPIIAATVTIGGFLLFSGLGSFTAQRIGSGSGRLLAGLLVGLIAIGLVELLLIGACTRLVGSLPLLGRCALAGAALLPLGFLMGFPMPTALARLDRNAPALIPWAWGVNGFASVLAAPAATAIGMTWGYSVAGSLALALYLLPALLFMKLPSSNGNRDVS